ncbi:PAS domain-containing protein [Streptomyces sp. 71268]|uniref:PAS domain-containing protein n=1 Tax=Streptomyces sp. 71268 TaxID=3002640 RepID=UPI0023FA345F|nr:PAS domain-containing protein [Streptomyces sp. 71268]WEV28633.1 PAS domain-containing protein [Streptomyces sp. 71268]
MTEGEDEGFSQELTDFRRRVEELRAVRALPAAERLGALDAALVELQHAADVLWPRFERWTAVRGDGRGNAQEQRLLRALFQRLPVAVALVDREAVVRRMNFAATQLFGTQAGYATGRTLTGWFRHDGRAALRSQIAAVARGEGGRVLLARVPRRPGATDPAPGLPGRTAQGEEAGPESAPDALWVTLGAIRPPDERQLAVLAVFQPADGASAANGPAATGFSLGADRSPTQPDLAEVSRQAEVLDLVDEAATALLSAPPGADPEAVALRAAQVLHRRFADWVVVDWANRDGTGGGGRPVETPTTAGAPEAAPLGGTAHGTGGAVAPDPTAATPVDARPSTGPGRAAPLRRLVVCGPDDGSGLVATVVAQDPADSPLVAGAVRSGTSALQVRPDEVAAFGLDASGAPVLVAAEVTSLLCVPLRVADAGPAQGALTVFRTGARRAFGMAEAGALDRTARHLALALDRAATSGTATRSGPAAAGTTDAPDRSDKPDRPDTPDRSSSPDGGQPAVATMMCATATSVAPAGDDRTRAPDPAGAAHAAGPVGGAGHAGAAAVPDQQQVCHTPPTEPGTGPGGTARAPEPRHSSDPPRPPGL